MLESKGLDLSSAAGAHQAIDKRDVFCGLVQERSFATSAFGSKAAIEIPAQPFVFRNVTDTETTDTSALRFDFRPGTAMKSLTQFALISTVAQTVDVMVGQDGLTFTPATVNINVGDTVRWTWSTSNHTVNSGSGCTSDGSYCSPNDTSCDTNPASGATAVYTHTFSQAGSFSYFCRIHCFSGMKGTVVVSSPSTLRIDSVAPPAGRDSGGQQVKLTGSFANLSSVVVGGVSASWSFSNGTSEVTLTTPANGAGAVNIDLADTLGGNYTKVKAFAYLPTAFTDNTLVAGVTTAKTQHIIELRQAVDALRAVAGLGPASWTAPTLSPFGAIIKAAHILELRSFLEDAASRLGYPAGPGYTDPGLTSGFVIKRAHVEDLRQRIRNIAG